MNQVVFSHNSDDWSTPSILYDLFIHDLNAFDPCPLKADFDGLLVDWHKSPVVFVNPPYSNIKAFVNKAIHELFKSKGSFMSEVYFLVPSRTDTKWFKDMCMSGFLKSVYFIEGRLRFNDGKRYAPFPSMLCCLHREWNSSRFDGYQLPLMDILKVVSK